MMDQLKLSRNVLPSLIDSWETANREKEKKNNQKVNEIARRNFRRN